MSYTELVCKACGSVDNRAPEDAFLRIPAEPSSPCTVCGSHRFTIDVVYEE